MKTATLVREVVRGPFLSNKTTHGLKDPASERRCNHGHQSNSWKNCMPRILGIWPNHCESVGFFMGACCKCTHTPYSTNSLLNTAYSTNYSLFKMALVVRQTNSSSYGVTFLTSKYFLIYRHFDLGGRCLEPLVNRKERVTLLKPQTE